MFKKLFMKKKLVFVFVISLAAVTAFTIIALNNRTEAIAPDQEEAMSAPANPAQPQTGEVTVKVQNYVSPEGKKCYQYTVENNADRPIMGFDIGLEASTFSTELNSLPDGWVPEYDEGGAVETPSSTSLVSAYTAEEQNYYYIATKSFRANPGETRGFHVCMTNDWDSSYQTAHWVAYMMGSEDTKTGQLIDLGPM